MRIGITTIRAAVDLLADMCHRRIRLVDGGHHPGAAQRRRRYRTAMRRHGLAADVVAGDHTEESGVRAARELIDGTDRITAVLASNDRCAFGVLDTLLRAGVDMPGDVSVIGYDDSRLAHLTHVDLTTIAQDAELARSNDRYRPKNDGRGFHWIVLRVSWALTLPTLMWRETGGERNLSPR